MIPEGFPTVLAASVSLAEGAGAVIPDLGLLQNPYRRPMVIEDIGFILRGPAAGAAGTQNWGGTIRLKLDMGRIGLTPGVPVPIWNFGVNLISRPLGTNIGGDTGNQSEEVVTQVGVDTGGVSSTIGRYKWKLPRPLFVPPGAILVPSFSRTADSQGGTVVASIAYNARVLPDNTPVPESIEVPFVAAFITTEGATFQISSDLDLFNPFVGPLNVQRFIGRLQARRGSLVIIDIGASSFTGDGSNNITLRMTDSRGRDVVREFTTWASVFPHNRRAWTAPVVLLPKDHYKVYYNAPTGLADGGLRKITGMISMIGWRRELLNA